MKKDTKKVQPFSVNFSNLTNESNNNNNQGSSSTRSSNAEGYNNNSGMWYYYCCVCSCFANIYVTSVCVDIIEILSDQLFTQTSAKKNKKANRVYNNVEVAIYVSNSVVACDVADI